MLRVNSVSVYGFMEAIRGMRNPMNSWDRSNSEVLGDGSVHIGDNDKQLMIKLVKADTEHRKFLRSITCYIDIIAPLYWWKEFDTYKIGTVSNSCSTMHKIHAKEFTIDDFSHEHVLSETFTCEVIPMFLLEATIKCLNENRAHYLATKDKKYWWQMIQLLPSSYNQRRSETLNYEVLRSIYKQRAGHKLDEWSTLREVIEKLPESWLITD